MEKISISAKALRSLQDVLLQRVQIRLMDKDADQDYSNLAEVRNTVRALLDVCENNNIDILNLEVS